VGIPVFAALAPYYLKIPGPLMEWDPGQTLGLPYNIAVSYVHKFINRVL
jgi:hypothetical protein